MEKTKVIEKDTTPYAEKRRLFQNLKSLLKTRYHKKHTKVYNEIEFNPVTGQTYKSIGKILVKVPFSICLKYNLISLNLSSFNEVNENGYVTNKQVIRTGEDLVVEKNGKYYAWMKPIVKNSKMYFLFKGNLIPARHVLGCSIDKMC